MHAYDTCKSHIRQIKTDVEGDVPGTVAVSPTAIQHLLAQANRLEQLCHVNVSHSQSIIAVSGPKGPNG